MKALVGSFDQRKLPVEAFSVIVELQSSRRFVSSSCPHCHGTVRGEEEGGPVAIGIQRLLSRTVIWFALLLYLYQRLYVWMDWLGCHVFYTYSYRHIHSESDLIRHPYISITWNITLLSKRIINLLLFLSDLTIVLYWLCLFCSWKSDYQWCLVSINCPDSGKHWLQTTPPLNTYTASNSCSATTSAIYILYDIIIMREHLTAWIYFCLVQENRVL